MDEELMDRVWGQLQEIPPDRVEVMRRLADELLVGTITMSTAMQSRAVMASGLVGAMALGLFAAAPTIGGAVGVGCATAASMLFVSALLLTIVARSTDFHVTGYDPARILKPEAATPGWIERSVVYDYQRRIKFNSDQLTTDSRWFNWGLGVALAALPVGILAWCYALRLSGT